MHYCITCKTNEVELEPGPPWDPTPSPGQCIACENREEEEGERAQLEALVKAAARAGRFDLI